MRRHAAKLLDAARALFARQGVDSTRIQEITDEADVGFGSFYNHFPSKEALIEAVLTAPSSVAPGNDPDWGRLLVRLDVSHNVLHAALGPDARRDLRASVRSGRLSVHATDSAPGGALLAVMRAVLDGQAQKDADIHPAGVLRLVGLPVDEAAEVARRPLPARS